MPNTWLRLLTFEAVYLSLQQRPTAPLAQHFGFHRGGQQLGSVFPEEEVLIRQVGIICQALEESICHCGDVGESSFQYSIGLNAILPST